MITKHRCDMIHGNAESLLDIEIERDKQTTTQNKMALLERRTNDIRKID